MKTNKAHFTKQTITSNTYNNMNTYKNMQCWRGVIGHHTVVTMMSTPQLLKIQPHNNQQQQTKQNRISPHVLNQ